jgi:HSP90 family molecular chaperone
MGLVLIASFLSEGSQIKQIFMRNKNYSRRKNTKSSVDVWQMQRMKNCYYKQILIYEGKGINDHDCFLPALNSAF